MGIDVVTLALAKGYTDEKISGCVITPTTATVGQVITVKAVDESGKPTAWEAADFPSGSGNVDLTDEEYTTLVALLGEE